MDRSTDAASILPPTKKFLDQEQLDEIWEARGLKFRVDELHMFMLQRGLLPYVDREVFRRDVFGILKEFLVEGGARRDPKRSPTTIFPRSF